MDVEIKVAPGEFFDRLCILGLKSARATGAQADVLNGQHRALQELRRAQFPPSPELDRLVDALADCNRKLWDLESRVRAFTRPLDPRHATDFANLAHAIFALNEDRAQLKQQIDCCFQDGSGEAKIYDAADQSSGCPTAPQDRSA